MAVPRHPFWSILIISLAAVVPSSYGMIKADIVTAGVNTLPPVDYVKKFSCGKLFYRTFFLDEARDSLYVGAMDAVYRLNSANITGSDCERDSLSLEPSSVANCVSRGKSEHFDCRNHIRVIQPMADGSRLYICGTNAHSPKDWVIHSNLTHLPRHEYVPGIGTGIAKCPFDPNDNSTAVWIETGNPGNLPGLYSGTNAEFTKADTVIFRTDLHNLTTGRREFAFKRTLKYDSKWLDKPNFVASFDVGKYVFFFFRETAVEYINCGKSIYSRVARVCKRDTGGKNILSQNWATFLKARLNCSIPGEFPFYFNEIQSMYKIPGDDTHFYGTFSTSNNGLMGSAVCSFTLESVQQAFADRFKEQATSSSAWLPVLSNRIPEPRPGQCIDDTETLPDTVLNFIRSHPLMDMAVEHEFSKPAFYKRDVIFTQIVVEKLNSSVQGKDAMYTIMYIGSNEGKVYKMVQWLTDEGAQSSSFLLDVYDVTPGEPIRVMEISKKHKAIYVGTDAQIKQVDLYMCKLRYDSCLRCVRDPHCGWDKTGNTCRNFKAGFLQDVENKTASICDSSVMKKKIVVTWGQSVHLSCLVHMSEGLGAQKVIWYHHKDKGKQQIVYRHDKYIETSDHGLVIVSVGEGEAGRYDAWLGPSLLCSYNLTVDSNRCGAPARSRDYQRVYSEWCHAFEKHKAAVQAWERKKSCSNRENNSIPNAPRIRRQGTES
ncbi:semaphorin-2A-like [Hetaerina americana]|uniref:semaphorin-2A-like n=1 Tax=Hetaerina americana TaxID=62018 RepID=UPI003A7F377A